MSEDVDTLENAIIAKEEMQKKGLQGIQIFAYEPKEKPDYITWGFVNAHLLP